MIKRTHIAIAAGLGLLFLPYVTYRWIFFPVVLIAALLPDIDSSSSEVGHRWYFRPLQWFVKHRGLIHSFSFCIVLSLLLAFFVPILAFPFFLGYMSHLFADSFTLEGITPFWPSKLVSNGVVRTGGKMEYGIFAGFVLADAILFMRLFV